MKNERYKVILEDATSNLEERINSIFDRLAPKSFNGMKVLIKPNMLGPSSPELGHTTHPEVVRAVVRACLDRGAKPMVGDNPGGINRSSHWVAQVTGILDASEDCYMPLAERVTEMKGIATGHKLMVSKLVLEADYVINLPIFKTHLGTYISGALKNVFGYIAGACKAELHRKAPNREEFAEMLCDVNAVRHPELHIMDVLTALEGNGPSHGGSLRQVGKIMASTNAVALDTAMALMMGVEPRFIPLLVTAENRGFGKADMKSITVEGELSPIPNFKLPATLVVIPTEEALKQAQLANETRSARLAEIISGRLATRPALVIDKCLQCGECEDNCPVQALTLDPYPVINDNCISCFCCVELCTEGALEVPDVAAFRSY